MEFTPLGLMILFYGVIEPEAAFLNIQPNKSQFFWYQSVNLSCAVTGSFSSWTLMRNTSQRTRQTCSGWGVAQGPSCIIEHGYPSDTGAYWCESPSGEPSNTVSISVTADAVILESPALPVTEGDKVTFLCSLELGHVIASNFSASFYKDGAFICNATNVTFWSVSKADEGSYKCEHPTRGASPQSWLAVNSRVNAPSPPQPLSLLQVMSVITLMVLWKLMIIVCVKLYRKWSRGTSYHQNE